MNEKNLAFLKDGLKYMGFGEGLYPELQKNMEQGFPQFVLRHQQDVNGKILQAELFFKRSEKSELYFFNSYDAKLKSETGKVEQTFYVNKGSSVTLKEAFNLLEGRAVHKELQNSEGQKYSAWLQLDFATRDTAGNFKVKQYHEKYGFDLEAALKKYSIQELGQERSKEQLLGSLRKGNLQAVTVERNGEVQRAFIEATPKYKNLNFYDQGGKKLMLSPHEKKEEQTVNVASPATPKQVQTEALDEAQKKEKSKKMEPTKGDVTLLGGVKMERNKRKGHRL